MITAWEYTPYPLVPSLPQDHPIPLGSPPSTVPSMGWMSYREARVLWVVQGIVGKGTQEYGRIVYLTTSLYLYSIPTLPFPLEGTLVFLYIHPWGYPSLLVIIHP